MKAPVGSAHPTLSDRDRPPKKPFWEASKAQGSDRRRLGLNAVSLEARSLDDGVKG